MPVPFRDAEEVEELGASAFLKVEPLADSDGYVAALFVVNARGEPLEFVYNRIETPDTFLWRPSDLRRHAQRKLVSSLLGASSRQPRLLLCQADEVGSELFCQDLQLQLPVGRVGRPFKANAYSTQETQESLEQPERLHLFWFPQPPSEGSPERILLSWLASRGLLEEPFERAAVGLREVYATDLRARVQ